MHLPKMLGYSVQDTLLRRCVCYAINPNIVVVGQKYASSLYSATDSGLMTRPPLRLRYYIRAGGSLDKTWAFA